MLTDFAPLLALAGTVLAAFVAPALLGSASPQKRRRETLAFYRDELKSRDATDPNAVAIRILREDELALLVSRELVPWARYLRPIVMLVGCAVSLALAGASLQDEFLRGGTYWWGNLVFVSLAPTLALSVLAIQDWHDCRDERDRIRYCVRGAQPFTPEDLRFAWMKDIDRRDFAAWLQFLGAGSFLFGAGVLGNLVASYGRPGLESPVALAGFLAASIFPIVLVTFGSFLGDKLLGPTVSEFRERNAALMERWSTSAVAIEDAPLRALDRDGNNHTRNRSLDSLDP